MKPIYLSIAVAAITLIISSCNNFIVETNSEGPGAPIELSQDKLEFSARGGESVLKCTNLSKCLISELEDKLTDTVYPPDLDEQYNPICVKCDGIVITTLDKTSVNIKVAESDKAHHWVLTMKSGNEFKPVDIVQK